MAIVVPPTTAQVAAIDDVLESFILCVEVGARCGIQGLCKVENRGRAESASTFGYTMLVLQPSTSNTKQAFLPWMMLLDLMMLFE